jgi:hypothetical protein
MISGAKLAKPADWAKIPFQIFLPVISSIWRHGRTGASATGKPLRRWLSNS